MAGKDLYGQNPSTQSTQSSVPTFDYSTPEGTTAFRDWYGKQQGGNRPEDMARWGIGGEEGEQSGDTFKRWDPYLIRSGAQAGKYRSSRGAEGFYDKPTECPPGMGPSGPRETDPCVPNSGGAGGAGGAGGGGGRGGKGASAWDNPVYQYLKGQALDPAKWGQTFMGQGGMSGFQQTIDQARAQAQQIQDPVQRQAELNRIETQLKPSLLTGGKQAGEQARMSMLSGQLMPQEYQYGALGEQAREANQNLGLGYYNAQTTRDLGYGNLGLAQGAQAFEQNTYFPWQQSESAANRDLQKWYYGQQLPTSGQKTMGAIGTGLSLLGKGYDIYKQFKGNGGGGSIIGSYGPGEAVPGSGYPG